jgi:2',3'-cyclic-nucleotide 2'-phosphodiesterase/3'-nucleotidase
VNKKIPDFLYQLFEGVNYEINLSQPVGSRIENLTWPDGIPVKDDDECDIAVNNYSAVSEILIPGTVYEENDMPVLLDSDIRSDIGGIRELIRDYIINVKKGLVTHEVNNNWKITGIG